VLRTVGLCAALLATAGTAAATTASLAVRLEPLPRAGVRGAPQAEPKRKLELQAVLASLPLAPLETQPLLAAGSARDASPSRASPEALPRASIGPTASHPLAAWFVLRFADPSARDAALATLLASGHVAETVRTLSICDEGPSHHGAVAAPADDVPSNVLQVRAPEALALVTPDTNLVVAVIDTGADLAHPDLVRRLWRNDDAPGNADVRDDATDQNQDGAVEAWERDDDDDNGYVDDQHGYDFTDAPGRGGFGDATGRDADPTDEQGHGTHVAGILCADGSLRGVAPFVRLMTVRAAYSAAFGGILETDDAAAAVIYAADNGARILNLSWGDYEESQLVHEAVAYALSRGCLVVAAAGNGGNATAHYPSGQLGVVGVGSVDGADQRSGFSNFGPGVSLYAPGERHAGFDGGIVSLAPGGGRAALRGTSMAAPHVAGVAAIVSSRSDHPDASRVGASMRAGLRHPPGEAGERGVLDAVQAVQALDPLVLEATGPSRAFGSGQLVLVGTVTGGDLARWRIDARRLADGVERQIVAWQSERVVADTLAATPLPDAPEGDWAWILAAEDAHGTRHEVRGPFAIDRSAPRLLHWTSVAAWRSGAPRWLFSAELDEEASMQLSVATGGAADPGLARRLQIEMQPGAATSGSAHFENGAGLSFDTLFVAPAELPTWPSGARLATLDSTASFRPSNVAGMGPGGMPLVWGVGLAADTLGSMQAWGVAGGRLVLRHDSHRSGRPVAWMDTNADASPDLLVQRGFAAEWIVTRAADSFPESLAARVIAERVLGFFQLDEDPPAEALLGSRDTLYILDDLTSGPPVLLQALANPSVAGFNVFGATAAVGDLDSDGRIEIACGDAEGNVAVFERRSGRYENEMLLDTAGTYAYELCSNLGAGFIVGRQASRNPAGDGLPTAAYEFIAYEPPEPGGPGWEARRTLSFLSPENDLRAACSTGNAFGCACVVLVRGADLYVMNGFGTMVSHLDGADGEAPALADLDGDGSTEMVLRTRRGARLLRLEVDRPGPYGLASESLGAGRLRLDWLHAGTDTLRVRRGLGAAWQTLGETTARTWIDSTAVSFVTYEYELQALQSGRPWATSNRIRASAQPLPRLLAAEALGPASLRVRCSNPLPAEAMAADHWSVADAGGVVPLATTALASAGREVQIVLGRALECGEAVVRGSGLRDDQNGRLDPAAAEVRLQLACTAASFAVADARIESNAVSLRFNRAFDPASLDVGRFALSWNGAPVPLVAAESIDSVRVRVHAAPSVVFVGRGLPYRLQIDPGLRAAADGAALAHPEIDYALYVEGGGATKVFPAPNPVRVADSGVFFAEAGTGTQVDIYDLEGQRVRSLSGAVGGGLRWDLRDTSGERVAPGAYFYVARDATGTSSGRVVVLR
jgi:hypothetical protein